MKKLQEKIRAIIAGSLYSPYIEITALMKYPTGECAEQVIAVFYLN